MENAVNQRLKVFVEALKSNRKVYNQSDFASKIGKSKTQLSEMLKGTVIVSERTVHKIASAFPELNREWLLYGEGSMLNPASSANNDSSTSASSPDDKLLAIIQAQAEEIGRLKERLKQYEALSE